MSSLRRILGVALVGLAAMSLVATESASADTGGDEMNFVSHLNGLRAAKGLAPLSVRGELFDVARAWSGRMAAAGALSHNPSLASQAPSDWTRLGENVGLGLDVDRLFEALANSPVHYANMVDPGFDSVGLGVVRDAAGEMFVTMNFMKGGTGPARTAAAAGGSAPAMVRKVVKVCSRNRRGRTVCVRKVQMVPA